MRLFPHIVFRHFLTLPTNSTNAPTIGHFSAAHHQTGTNFMPMNSKQLRIHSTSEQRSISKWPFSRTRKNKKKFALILRLLEQKSKQQDSSFKADALKEYLGPSLVQYSNRLQVALPQSRRKTGLKNQRKQRK
jgi:hypothetical protein